MKMKVKFLYIPQKYNKVFKLYFKIALYKKYYLI